MLSSGALTVILAGLIQGQPDFSLKNDKGQWRILYHWP